MSRLFFKGSKIMKNSFINILREPDSVLFQLEDSLYRFEEPKERETRGEIDFKVVGNEGRITVHPSSAPISRVKLRWRGDMSDALLLLGDSLERNYDISQGNVQLGQVAMWRGVCAEMRMPWYFHVYDGERLNSYGVKTGADAFCHFHLDEKGITLWLDLRSGGMGVDLKEPLLCARVVQRCGVAGENPYFAARDFCKMMCEKPILPKSPIFGVNNWYWAYGRTNHELVMEETDNLIDMCRDAKTKPYMIIDDGWQVNRHGWMEGLNYIGGPWTGGNSGFPSMEDTAYRIKEKGAHPGVWFRALLTDKVKSESMHSPYQKDARGGVILDPSNPDVLSLVTEDVKRIISWGYEVIKHDFSTFDIMGKCGIPDGSPNFYDRTKTTCTVIKNFYKTIAEAAGGAEIIGCNTINHLAAGIFSVQRTGHDTSGRVYEITRAAASAAVLRLPQNKTFFSADPDCAAFTERVPISANLDFLELCAVTGQATLASVTPGIIKGEDMKRIRRIYEIASIGGLDASPLDWLGHNAPSRYKTKDGFFEIDWYKTYDGCRLMYEWMN